MNYKAEICNEIQVMKNLSTFIIFAVVLTSCANEDHSIKNPDSTGNLIPPTELTFAEATEVTHQKELFMSHDSLVFDLQLFFGGSERLNGELAMATNSTGGRISYKDGRFITYNQEGVQHSDQIDPSSARFGAYTWSYFALMPFKLTDPGTHWEQVALDYQDGKSSHQLTFGENIGDAPDDWYIVNTDDSGLLKEAAYIVTAGSSVEEAETDPHAIQYENYQMIEGVPVAHNWTFYAWSKQAGSTDTLGYATLSNVRFK